MGARRYGHGAGCGRFLRFAYLRQPLFLLLTEMSSQTMHLKSSPYTCHLSLETTMAPLGKKGATRGSYTPCGSLLLASQHASPGNAALRAIIVDTKFLDPAGASGRAKTRSHCTPVASGTR